MAPFSGSSPNKTYARDTGVYNGATSWAQTDAAVRGIRSDDHDTHDQDMAAAINSSLQKDGVNKPTANIDWGAYLITNLGGLSSATEVTVASATTTDVLGAASFQVLVSGTVTITSLGTGTKALKIVRFSGALTLTHNATTLILPTGANITTAAGDTMVVCSDGSSNARVIAYQRASGAPLIGYAAGGTDVALADGGTGASLVDPNADRIMFWDDSAGAVDWLTAGTGLAITATTIAADIGLQTIYVPASGMTANTTNGPASGIVEVATNLTMLKTLDFDATTAESAQFAVQMPVSWDEGTVTAKAVWKHAATTTNFGVVWDIAGGAYGDNETPTTFGTAVTMTDTGGTTNNIYISPTSAACTIAGTIAAGDWVVFRVRRAPADGSDTMAIDAGLLGVSIFYTINALKDN